MITGFGTSLQTRCLLQPDVLPKSQATHTRLSGSEGDGAYSNEGLSHTDLPTSGAYIPSSRPAVF